MCLMPRKSDKHVEIIAEVVEQFTIISCINWFQTSKITSVRKNSNCRQLSLIGKIVSRLIINFLCPIPFPQPFFSPTQQCCSGMFVLIINWREKFPLGTDRVRAFFPSRMFTSTSKRIRQSVSWWKCKVITVRREVSTSRWAWNDFISS